MMTKDIVLTGDRPTGPLHLGHYVGSLRKRIDMQDSGQYEIFLLIADIQALTDNSSNPSKIRENLLEVALDYLAVGLLPEKCHFTIQSHLPALFELPMYYSNLVSTARLERNPTIKAEINLRGFDASLPVGFMYYPISQSADITAFKAKYVPVGADQLPMIEQTREIVDAFNRIYQKDVLVKPVAVLPDKEICYRFVGTDGNSKMSKSLGNCIYLKDSPSIIKEKVMGMFTDPNHVSINDPGEVENNPVFIYLDAFSRNEHFIEYCPEYFNLEEMKSHYKRGGLGDVKVKKFLNSILQEELSTIRNRRQEYEKQKSDVLQLLKTGTEFARSFTDITLQEVRDAIGINYFHDKIYIDTYVK